MKILVTGAAGFIGSALCKALCEEGHEVLAFHRTTAIKRGLVGLPVKLISGDLTDPDSVEAAFDAKPDAVFHLAAHNSAFPSVQRMNNVNITGSRTLLRAAQKRGTGRIVMMSSAYTIGFPEVISDGETPPLLDESHVWNGSETQWPFTASKVRMEQEAQLACAGGMDIVIVNPCKIIGPGDVYRRGDSILLKWKQDPPKILVPGGLNILPLADAVRGLINALEYGKRGERYLLCGENMTLERFVTLCADSAPFQAPRLMLSASLVETVSKLRYNEKLSQNSYSETDLFAFPGRYFYYDPRKSRIGLHLPVPGSVSDAIREAYRWFEENA